MEEDESGSDLGAPFVVKGCYGKKSIITTKSNGGLHIRRPSQASW